MCCNKNKTCRDFSQWLPHMNTGLHTTLFKIMQTNKNKIFVIWIKHHTNEYIVAILTTNVTIIS